MKNRLYHLSGLKAFAYLEIGITLLLLSVAMTIFFPLQRQAIEDTLFASYLTEAQLCLRNLILVDRLQRQTRDHEDKVDFHCQPQVAHAVVHRNGAQYCLQWDVPRQKNKVQLCTKS